MEYKVVLGDWDFLQFFVCLVCDEVFIQEQKVLVEEEWDDMDKECLYVVVYDKNGEILGIVRLLLDGYIGCMVVRKIGCGFGVGGVMFKLLILQVKECGYKEVVFSV